MYGNRPPTPLAAPKPLSVSNERARPEASRVLVLFG